jgi:hypothetical protein
VEEVNFEVLDTPIVVEPSAALTPLNIFGLTLIITRAQPLTRRVWLALLAVANYFLADLGHYGGHIFSSRYANAPMDEVRVKAPLPKAVNHNNAVSPETHMLRAIGGPIGSGLFFSLAMLLRLLWPAKSAGRDFFNVMAIFNGLLTFGSLLPLPFIDGGALLKWGMVNQGQTETEADATVRQANIMVGRSCLGLGSALAMRKQFIAGIALLVNAAVFLAIGLGKLKLD